MDAPATPGRMDPQLLREDGGAVSPIAAADASVAGDGASFSGAVSPVKLSVGTTLEARLELSSVGPTVFQPRVIVANDGSLPESLSAPARDHIGHTHQRNRPHSSSGRSFAVDTATSALGSPERRSPKRTANGTAAAASESKAHRIARISVEFEQHQADLVANERASRARKQPFERSVSQSVRAMLRQKQRRPSESAAVGAATSELHGGAVYRSEADAASYETATAPTAASSRPVSASRVRPWSAASRGVSSAASSRPPSAQKRNQPPADPSLEPTSMAPAPSSVLRGTGLRQPSPAHDTQPSPTPMNDAPHATSSSTDHPRPVSADPTLHASIPRPTAAPADESRQRPATSMGFGSRGAHHRHASDAASQRRRPASALASQVRIARKALAVDEHDDDACEELAMRRTGAARSAVYQAAAAPGPIGFSFSGDNKASKKKFAFSSQRMEGAAESHAGAPTGTPVPLAAAANDGVPIALSAESIALRAAVHRAQAERDSRTPANARTRLSLVGEDLPASRDFMPEAPVHQSRTEAMQLKVAASPSSRASRVRMVFSAPTPLMDSSGTQRSQGRGAAFELPTPSKVSSVVSGADIARMRQHEQLAAAEAEATGLEHSVLPPQPVVSPIRRSASPSGAGHASTLRAGSEKTASSADDAADVRDDDDDVEVPFAADATGDARRAAAAGRRGLVTLARSMRRESHDFWMAHRPPASTVAMFEHRATVRAREKTRQAEAPVWAGPFHGMGGRDVSPSRHRSEHPSYLERIGYAASSPPRGRISLTLGGRTSLTQQPAAAAS